MCEDAPGFKCESFRYRIVNAGRRRGPPLQSSRTGFTEQAADSATDSATFTPSVIGFGIVSMTGTRSAVDAPAILRSNAMQKASS
jgi:hypothetical protein